MIFFSLLTNAEGANLENGNKPFKDFRDINMSALLKQYIFNPHSELAATKPMSHLKCSRHRVYLFTSSRYINSFCQTSLRQSNPNCFDSCFKKRKQQPPLQKKNKKNMTLLLQLRKPPWLLTAGSDTRQAAQLAISEAASQCRSCRQLTSS